MIYILVFSLWMLVFWRWPNL